jgi:hypothetical protein
LHEFTVSYTEDIARRSVRALCGRTIRRRHLQWKFAAAFLLLTAALVLGHSGRGVTWLDGAAASLLAVLILFAVFLYRAYIQRSLDRLHRMKTPVGYFVLTDATLTVTSDLGSYTVPWREFVDLSEHADFWLLNTSADASLTIPIHDVSPEAREYLRQKIASGGTDV